jgi:hypothetical protein
MAIPAGAALIAISGTGLGACNCGAPVGQATSSSSSNTVGYVAAGMLALLVGYGLWGVKR